MVDRSAEALAVLRSALGKVLPPTRVTQAPYDGDDAHLRALVSLKPGAKASATDLWDYAQDLQYGEEVQLDLLYYALPFCLQAWSHDLRGDDSSYGGFVEHFYPALVRVVNEIVARPTVLAAISTFMRNAIVEEIDAQRGLSYSGSRARPHRWIGALATFGVLFPDVNQLWTTWWSIATIGRAVALVQYASCLVYDDHENPVFDPWTHLAGGGPPTLWEFAGNLYAHRWLARNVDFLRATLNPVAVSDALSRAVHQLVAQPEHDVAIRVSVDAAAPTALLQRRCRALPRLFETEQGTQPLQWSDGEAE